MPLTKKSMGGEEPASPPQKAKPKEAKPVANVKVRVLYPTAFAGVGVDVYKQTKDKQGRVISEEALEEVAVDSKVAAALIQAGHAEAVK